MDKCFSVGESIIPNCCQMNTMFCYTLVLSEKKIGKFDDAKHADDFMVDYLKVYQNENHEQYLKDYEF